MARANHETTAVDPDDEQLDDPVKIRWKGRTRTRISERQADYTEGDGPRSPARFLAVVRRQKTQLKIRSVEEATAIRAELSCYDAGTEWINRSAEQGLDRVTGELDDKMDARGYEWTAGEGYVDPEDQQTRRQARRETRRKTEYGRWSVNKIQGHTSLSEPDWTVEYDPILDTQDPAQLGIRGDRKAAKALAAALDAAGLNGSDIPDQQPERHSEQAEQARIPARLLTDGKPAVAGYMAGMFQARTSEISHKLGVSEQSVRQYLSDLRAGRRSD